MVYKDRVDRRDVLTSNVSLIEYGESGKGPNVIGSYTSLAYSLLNSS
jgi:hypothetical protein